MGTTTALLVETGEKRDGRGYRIATLARRPELVAEYRQGRRIGSGLKYLKSGWTRAWQGE